MNDNSFVGAYKRVRNFKHEILTKKYIYGIFFYKSHLWKSKNIYEKIIGIDLQTKRIDKHISA